MLTDTEYCSIPSPQDIEVTKRIQVALEPISISVLDHIIAAGQAYVSCSEKRLL
nr:JAB domain-containing protein [Desulfosporosinus sp. BICA1-9]